MSTTTADRKTLRFGSESREASTNALRNVAELGGRVLLAVLFLVSGLGKIAGYAVTAGYLAAVGLPSALLPVVIATEVLGAIAIVAGWQT
ncbi:MAG TPA: DoxX family protein, partial [Gammaproteobacteria bacterium]|nr:DoxX family protein [Gammaproteobacteria bacterium]